MENSKGLAKRAITFYHYLFGERLFIIALLLLVIGMPVSPFLVGFSQFLLLFNWLMEGRFGEKIYQFKVNRALQVFLLAFLIHVFWLANTSNVDYALHDIKIKLPLLILPVFFANGYKISMKMLKFILLIFTATVIVGTFISVAVYLQWLNYEVTDIRNISIFISHIRFGLMIDFSIIILIFYLRQDFFRASIFIKLAYALAILWLCLFLLLLQSTTSWIVMLVLTFVLIIIYYKRIKSLIGRLIASFYIVGAPISVVVLFAIVLSNFYSKDKVDFDALPKHTKQGNRYQHHYSKDATENGHYLWLYISYIELRNDWPKYSNLAFEGSDEKGQPLKFTIIRYLTSKNLTKDAEGLAKLDSEDIKLIEEGYASCVYRNAFTPYVKANEIVWELDQYFKYGNPNAKTVSMRIEFLKAGLHIIKNNFWWGVGTGDIQDSFNKYYEDFNSKLESQYRYHTHNQYITFFITFGCVGFILMLFAWSYPIFAQQNKLNALLLSFLIIFLLSMINEDTLETQSGVTFVVFFYSLFVFRKRSDE